MYKDVPENHFETAERFNALFEQSPVALQIYNLDGLNLYANPAWETLYATPRTALKDFNILKDEQLKKWGMPAFFQRALEGEMVRIPPILFQPSLFGGEGRERWTEVLIFPLKDRQDQVRELAFFILDVTNVILSHQHGEESDQQYRLLADTIPQLVWVTDENGGVEYINTRWFEYTGQTPGVRTSDTWKDVIHPDDLEPTLKIHQEAIANRSALKIECRIRRKDGEYHWHLVRTVFILDERNGKIVRFGTATDIHDQKAVAEALQKTKSELRKSRDQLDVILQGAGVGILAHDTSGKYVFANELAAHLSGFASTKEFLNASAEEIYRRVAMRNEDNTALDLGTLPSRAAQRGEMNPPEKLVRYGGAGTNAKWAIIRSKPVFNEKNEVILVVTIFRDISDLKAAELEREKFHEVAQFERSRLEAVIKQVETGVMIISADTKNAIFMNDKVKEIWRKSDIPFEHNERAESFQTYRLDGTIFESKDWPSLRSIDQGLTVKDEEVEIKRGDGTRGYIKISSSPIRDSQGEIVAALVTLQDVTDIRQQELSSRFLDEASQILSTSLDYHCTLNAIAKFTVPRLADWCSIAIVDPPAQPLFIVMHEDKAMLDLAEEYRTRYPTDWNSEQVSAQVLRSGKSHLVPIITEELLRATALDAHQFELMKTLKMQSAILVPIQSHGKIYGVLTLVSSRKNRVYADHDLKVSEDLGKRAGQAIENAKLYEQAQSAIRARDSLISVSAHELLTPVSGSKLQMEIMRKRIAQGVDITPAMLLKMVEQTERQLDRLSRLVNEMLDLSRINLGKLTLEKIHIDLSQLVYDIVERMRAQLESVDCKVSTFIEPDIFGALDSYRVEQVLTNLLSNACRYARKKPVMIRLRLEDSQALLSVEDQGIGVREEDHDRIFHRFERAATIDEGSGLGIGLFLVKQIVEAHGGSVHLQSVYGAGSTFKIRLPLG